MGNLHYRPNFNLCKINKIFYHSVKEHLKISRIAKFGCEMLKIEENIASPSLRICIQMYYARKSTKMVGFRVRKHLYANSQTLRCHIFLILQYFATKLGNSTNFKMLFRGVIKYFVYLA